MNILPRPRARVSLLLTALLLVLFVWPWPRQISAPARIEPAMRSDIFPPLSAHISQIHTDNDDHVKKGDVLFTLSSDTLSFETKQSRARLKLIEAQMARRHSNLDERRSGTMLDDEYRREQAAYAGLIAQNDKLIIRAPQDGVISGISPHLHEGRMIALTQALARISNPNAVTLLALAPEQDAQHITQDAALIFIADDPALPKLTSTISRQAPTARTYIDETELTSLYGGKIAVHTESDEGLIPVNPVYEIRAELEDFRDHATLSKGRTIRGLAKIKGPREAYISRIGRQVWRVLIREGDF